jgi:hypothetical protein
MNVRCSSATPAKAPPKSHQISLETQTRKKISKMKVAPRMLLKTKGQKKSSSVVDEKEGLS